MADNEIGDEDPTAELEAMGTMASALRSLDHDARTRVIAWVAGKFGIETTNEADTQNSSNSSLGEATKEHDATRTSYRSFAELIEGVELKSNSDRGLFAAYWLQEFQGDEFFDGRSINKLLKEHGIDISNVTNALTSLINSKPSLAMQAGKKGKFEKLYRLTTEGKKQVRLRLQGGSSAD